MTARHILEQPEPGEPSITLLGRDFSAALALHHYADLLEQDIVNGRVTQAAARNRIEYYREVAKDMEEYARGLASKIHPADVDDSSGT